MGIRLSEWSFRKTQVLAFFFSLILINPGWCLQTSATARKLHLLPHSTQLYLSEDGGLVFCASRGVTFTPHVPFAIATDFVRLYSPRVHKKIQKLTCTLGNNTLPTSSPCTHGRLHTSRFPLHAGHARTTPYLHLPASLWTTPFSRPAQQRCSYSLSVGHHTLRHSCCVTPLDSRRCHLLWRREGARNIHGHCV